MNGVDLRSETFHRLSNNDFNCEKELTMSVISGKYKVVIIWHLGNERPYRYGELSRLFKQISNRMLTKQLRELEHDDIIRRIQYQSQILHTEYSLTERGFTLLPIVNSMYKWGQDNMDFYVEQLHKQREKNEK
ncbi:MAG: helix-turn-helix transcriptional regulator [Lachnospiraceae bacterium]|nr:helix-turn-helix transcriptional regulator [Lachnospiraceae bacterium]MCD7956732.1 helix-turn-helix transcriptional regulator [Lachnospiraceae bacterium]